MVETIFCRLLTHRLVSSSELAMRSRFLRRPLNTMVKQRFSTCSSVFFFSPSDWRPRRTAEISSSETEDKCKGRGWWVLNKQSKTRDRDPLSRQSLYFVHHGADVHWECLYSSKHSHKYHDNRSNSLIRTCLHRDRSQVHFKTIKKIK